MKIFLIGDVQGCYRELAILLDKMAPGQGDKIWFCGDLVGRGPQALEVMELVCGLPGAQTVLGNHDLHLLAIAGGVRPNKASLRLDKLLSSPRIEDYLDWLRSRPLALACRDILLVHASVHPGWSEEKILSLAAQVQEVLRSPECAELLRDMYGNRPSRWSEALRGPEYYRVLLNIFTRARYYQPDGRLNLDRDDHPRDALPGDQSVPWYELKHRRRPETMVFFGHWSALADYNIAPEFGVYHLDKGCVWGNRLFGVEIFWEERSGDRSAGTALSQADPRQNQIQAPHALRSIRPYSVAAGQEWSQV